ncbi:alpha/beta fold hydrolase [Streptomyces sp. AC512_CC834]|uniref:alpha/beta fold hydrolase n=1 Tax=Streptomyces sp. AC512_CC834 TaxID=2823691 RepID=UPI001C277493|nr:alpha/beta hydrolase [Streptomyces sp. AC512_CC834]
MTPLTAGTIPTAPGARPGSASSPAAPASPALPSSRHPLRPARPTRTVTTDDGAEIAVYTYGAPTAPVTVLLCHGWTMCAQDWRPHTDALVRPRRGFPAVRVVTYDQRGHGRSTRGEAVLDMALLGSDLALVLGEAARDGGPVVLVGHSMGGMSIQQLAAARPGLFGAEVAGVGLVSTCLGEVAAGMITPRERPGTPAARRHAQARRRVADGLLRSPRSAEAVHRLVTGPLSHPTAAPLWRAVFGTGPHTETVRAGARAFREIPVLTIAEFYAALTTHDCMDRLGALARVPTRVLVGALDCVTPPAQALRLVENIPGAVLQAVPGQGHDLPYERPVLVVETVYALLREIPRSPFVNRETPPAPRPLPEPALR